MARLVSFQDAALGERDFLQAFVFFGVTLGYVLMSVLGKYSKFVPFKTGFYALVAVGTLLLPVLDLSLTVPAAMMVLDRKPVQIGQIPAIGMAAYTTYKVVLAAIGLKRSKRTESLAEKALRTIAFTDALVSVLTLQNTLIVVMDGGMGGKMQILSACSSAALLALAVFAAVWNIVIGRRSAAQRR